MNITIIILLFATISLFSMILSAAAVLFILHRMKRKRQLQISKSDAAPTLVTGEDTAPIRLQ